MSRNREDRFNFYDRRDARSKPIQDKLPAKQAILPENLCQECGRDRINNPCQPCADKDLEEFRMVRDFIAKYPRSNAMEVANATRVSISKILRLMKDGRINQYE